MFYENYLFYILVIVILFLFGIFNKNAWSKGVLSKDPNALICNNTIGIVTFILIIAMFLVFSWQAGLITLALCLIIWLLVGGKAMKKHVKENYPNVEPLIYKQNQNSKK